jgi:hypothetical protein
MLATAVGQLLGDERRRRHMAEAARRAALERFGVRTMVRGLEARLRTLATEGVA